MEELEAIVQRMIDAGETEENIKTVIQGYDAEVEKTNDSQTTDVAVESEEGTASNSDDGSLELPEVEEFNPTKLPKNANAGEAPQDFNKSSKAQEVAIPESYVDLDASLTMPYVDVGNKHQWLNQGSDEEPNIQQFFDNDDDEAVEQLRDKYPGFDFEATSNFPIGSFGKNEDGDLKYKYPEKQAQGFNVVKITNPRTKESKLIEFNINAAGKGEDRMNELYQTS